MRIFRISEHEDPPDFNEQLASYMNMMIQLRSTMSKPEGFHYTCIEEFIKKNGRPYSSAELTEEEAESVRVLRKITGKPKIKQCENCGSEFTSDIGTLGLPKGRFCPHCEENRERLGI